MRDKLMQSRGQAWLVASTLAVLAVVVPRPSLARSTLDFTRTRLIPEQAGSWASSTKLRDPSVRYVPLKGGTAVEPYSFLPDIADGRLTPVKASEVPAGVRVARASYKDFIENGWNGGAYDSSWKPKSSSRSPFGFGYSAWQNNAVIGVAPVYDLVTGMRTAFVRVDSLTTHPSWWYVGVGTASHLLQGLQPDRWYKLEVGNYSPLTYQPAKRYLPEPAGLLDHLGRAVGAVKGTLAGTGPWQPPLAAQSKTAPVLHGLDYASPNQASSWVSP